jgi:hypothetical protein
MLHTRLRKAGTLTMVFLVLCVPYTLGLLLTRPAAMRVAAEGFLQRSLVFMSFFICLHALIGAMRWMHGTSSNRGPVASKAEVQDKVNPDQSTGKVKGKSSKSPKKRAKLESPASSDETLSPTPIPPRKRQILKTAAVLLSGAFCLLLLGYAERSYSHITGATSLLMVLFGAFPLLEVLRRRRSWKLYLVLLVVTQTLVAFTSIVVHFADTLTSVLTFGLLTFSYQQVAAGLGQLIPPLLLALVAGCIGSMGTLFLLTGELTDELDMAWSEHFKTAMLVLLFIPAPLIALLGYFSILPPHFRYAYLGLATVVVIAMRFRSNGTSKAGFRLAALVGALINYGLFLSLAVFF